MSDNRERFDARPGGGQNASTASGVPLSDR